ncbi:MAG TPA: aspartate/glutamate racemase family protein [Anaerolineae bacterium]|nr:aspartate/glutamate racemase family protein [Anaerolineae bacterium]
MAKILYIDPLGVADLTRARNYLNRRKRESTELVMLHLPRGPRHLEYRYYEALVLVDILHLVGEAEAQGFDAAVIGCFYDIGLRAAREIAERMPVVAPCEASLQIAAPLGAKFSIIVGRRKWIPQMRENVIRYGMGAQLASFKSVDLGVLEFHQDEVETARRFRRVGREAIEADGAEVLVLGCSMTYGFFEDLQKELGVPVIDPMLAAFKMAEFAAEVGNVCGWTQSKVGGYQSPQPAEFQAWGLDSQYDYGHMGEWLRKAGARS